MPTLPQADDKPITTLTQFRSSGDVIDFVAIGGEVVGDVVVRAAATQSIGIVSAVKNHDSPTAVAGELVVLQVEGLIRAPIADGAYADGARVAWSTGNSNFAANATGAHEIVGGYVSGDTHALVRINKFPGAET